MFGKLGALGRIGALGSTGAGGGLAPGIVLSNAFIAEDAAIGVAVGTLSVSGAYTGTPVFALSNSAGGKFAVDGTALEVAGVLDYDTAPTPQITVTVSGITPTAPPKDFIITVIPSGANPGYWTDNFFAPRYYATRYF